MSGSDMQPQRHSLFLRPVLQEAGLWWLVLESGSLNTGRCSKPQSTRCSEMLVPSLQALPPTSIPPVSLFAPSVYFSQLLYLPLVEDFLLSGFLPLGISYLLPISVLRALITTDLFDCSHHT